MRRLDFFTDDKLFMRLKLTGRDILVGRTEPCEVQLPSDRVSRVHAVIRRRGETHELEDRSLNGTRVNDVVVRDGVVTLNPGDRIYIEQYLIVYREARPAAPKRDAGTDPVFCRAV